MSRWVWFIWLILLLSSLLVLALRAFHVMMAPLWVIVYLISAFLIIGWLASGRTDNADTEKSE